MKCTIFVNIGAVSLGELTENRGETCSAWESLNRDEVVAVNARGEPFPVPMNTRKLSSNK